MMFDAAKAIRHLGRREPILKEIIRRVGPCTLAAEPGDPFTTLVRCVVYQQISTAAARTIFNRLAERLAGPPLGREQLRALDAEQLRACGVSGPKQRTIQAVLAFADANEDFLRSVPALDDATIHDTLTRIKGIGPWSVDMFLMFGQGRPDVWPVGDLGIRAAVKQHWELPALPDAAYLTALAERWQPWRTVAAWYLWRSLGGPIPQSGQGG